jgi:dTDP-4-dehydrorhamnose reductase
MHRLDALVIGSNGQLGTDMLRVLREHGLSVEGLDVPTVDITQPESIAEAVRLRRPAAVINCAAFTDVDACESNRDNAFAVNATGAGNCAAAATAAGAAIIHISTDYVFDGAKKGPYLESDAPNPQSVYGASKLEGERLVAEAAPAAHRILRIAWLYGVHGKNFVKTIRRIAADRAARGEEQKVVDDQTGTPTYTVEVCRQVAALMSSDASGVFHCTAEGACTWFDFARLITAKAGIPVKVVPCTTEEFPRPARRPANSVLENARLKGLGLNVMKQWEEGFEEFLEEERTKRSAECGVRSAEWKTEVGGQ